MLTLYFAPGASSMAPHIALHEIGTSFESRPLSLGKKENRDPAFLAINPEGKVPTLVIDGRPLTEVAAILFYLARRFPEAGLLPTNNIEAEAQVVSWMSFIAATVHPARRQGPEHARAVYRIADQRLGGQEWAVGHGALRTDDDAARGDEDDRDRVFDRLSAARVAIRTPHRPGARRCQPRSARTTGDIRP